MKSLLTLFAVVALTAGSANAQIDPDQSGVGIYFDNAATINAVTAAPFAELIAYLIVTRVSVDGYAKHLEGYVDWNGPAEMILNETVGGVDLDDEMPVAYYDDIYVNFEPGAIPTGPTMVLKRYHLRVWSSDPCWFTIRSLRFWTTGPTGQCRIGANPSSGDWSRPVAAINAEPPVRTQSASWTEVKNLYR